MGAAILFQKAYVVSDGKPTLPPASRRKHWPVCSPSTASHVAVTAYVDILLLTEYRWEQNATNQNLKESELRYKFVWIRF